MSMWSSASGDYGLTSMEADPEPQPNIAGDIWPSADQLAEMSMHDQEMWERRCAAAEAAPEAAEAEPVDQPVPYTLTLQAEEELDASAEAEPEPQAGLDASDPNSEVEAAADSIRADMERDRLAREAEAELGHDYEGREAQVGTPEYDRMTAEYEAEAWGGKGPSASYEEWQAEGRIVVDLEVNPELEPDLGPTLESIEQGAEPDDALNPHATSDILEAPAPEDDLDVAYGAAEARQALAEAEMDEELEL
jgi:hypothetical protein